MHTCCTERIRKVDDKINKNILVDNPSASQSSIETWCNNVNCRIHGILHTAVEQQDTNCRDTVKTLI